MTGFRKFLLNVHLWIGLGACLLLFVLGLTGAALVYENQIDHLLNRSLAYVTPQAQRVSLDELAANVKKQYPGARIVGVDLSTSSPSPDLAFSFSIVQGKQRQQVFVDQYTGRVLGARNPAKSLMVYVHQLHTNLLGGPAWSIVNTWGSVLLCLLAMTGIYLWWPRKIFGANFSASGRRINFDLHNSIGFYASVFVFLFAFTAVVIHWENPALPVAGFLTRSHAEEDPQLNSAVPPPGAKPISLDAAYQAAAQREPGARVTQMSLPAKPKDIVRVWMKFPEDGTPAGRTWMFVDQFSGQVLYERNARTTALGWRYVKEWNREIHTGDILGGFSKIIALLASLAVAFLSFTGPLIWFLKLKTKPADSAPAGQEELEEQLA